MARLACALLLVIACNSGSSESARTEQVAAAPAPGRALAAEIEQTIATGLADRYGVTIAAVRCPAATGDALVCTAVIAGGAELPVDVALGTDAGRFVATEKPVILTDKLEAVIAQRYAALDQRRTADCGPAIRVSEPGSTFDCTLDDGATVGVTVTSWQGRVELTYPGTRSP